MLLALVNGLLGAICGCGSEFKVPLIAFSCVECDFKAHRDVVVSILVCNDADSGD